MRVRGKNAVLIGAEGRTPPLPFIEVTEEEGLSLIGLGVAEEAHGAADVAAPAAEPESAGEASDAGLAEPAPAEPGASSVDSLAEVVTPPADATSADEAPSGNAASDRDEAILEAFELLTDEDLVKTGERAGRPRVSAIEEATGFTDVSVEELDRLWAARG